MSLPPGDARNMRIPTVQYATMVLLTLLLSMMGCIPPEMSVGNAEGDVSVDLRDPIAQQLYNWRDEQKSDSLLRFLNASNPTYRYLAALSFASIRDSAYVQQLTSLLGDPVDEVRIAAAFALGQIASPEAQAQLIVSFASDDSLSQRQRFNATVLEALGKCAYPSVLRQIAAVTTYLPTDTLLLEGQCRAVYQFALRKITDTLAIQRMVEYIGNERIPESARLIAAHALARPTEVIPDSAQSTILGAALIRSTNPEIRMALAKALGKAKNNITFGILSKLANAELDWRVQCNVITALSGFPYDTVRSIIVPYIFNKNTHIARTAAAFWIDNGLAKDADYYWRIAKDRPELDWSVKIALFRASNKWLSYGFKPESKEFVNYRLREMFLQAENPYERAECLRALSESGWQFRWIYDKGMKDQHPAVKTAAADALVNIAGRPDFYRHFGEGAASVRRELYECFRQMTLSDDPGVVAAAAPGFEIKEMNFSSMRDTTRQRDLVNRLNTLQLPASSETYSALQHAIAFLEGSPKPKPFKPEYNHPIDWNQLASLNENTTIALATTFGNIEIELYPQWAPGSVANFLKLVSSGFYNGKVFHRVVPNFVVQAGCPRGDGYGSLDYSLRTEIGLMHYNQAGYLGMASAGPDTEGTQFFITHSATPHLDGRYTIFGKVIRGQEALNKLQVGSTIQKASVN
jgi:cyclophilin family peptidyl-prolyl cis-trans isomerase/HEAT repeat protein